MKIHKLNPELFRKADPRLQCLLSIPLKVLTARHRRETEALVGAEEAWRATFGEDRVQDQRKLLAFQRRFPIPSTYGFVLPKGSRRASGPQFASKEAHFSVLIWSEANAGFLRERFGASVMAAAGEIHAAMVPYSKMRALLQSPAIRFVELTRALLPNLDYTRGFTHADTLHGQSLTGAGVVIGNCEYEGLDLHHPDFADPNNPASSRVLAYWDQRLVAITGEAPPSSMGGFTGGWGVEYSQTQINQELATYPLGPTWSVVRLSNGGGLNHPTAVVGCAAGNGMGSGGQFAGIAPGSDIIAARIFGLYADLDLWWTDASSLLVAISYVFEKAALLGKPCVVNISMGDNGGPHDGSMLGDRFLDALLNQPGRAITASAGNSNNTGCHAYGQVQQGNSADLKLNFGPFPVNYEYVEIWYDGHDRLSVSILEPGQATATIGPLTAPSGAGPISCVTDSTWQIQVTSTVGDARNGDNVIGIAITRKSGFNLLPLNDWVIRIQGDSVISGTFHAWTGRYNRYHVRWLAPFLLEDHATVGSPGTGRGVITAGSHDKSSPTPLISAFSGCGPTRDGRMKPDIASVGELTSAVDRDLNTNPNGPLYGPAVGTSFSSPVVAGACALLFQCRGAWASWGNLRQILQDTAGTTGLIIPSDSFGSGFLQLETACSGPAPQVDVWLKDHPLDNGTQPFIGPVAWMSPDIQLYDRDGINPAVNAIHDPVNRYNHQVFVTVRNRGTQKARNTEVYFYWADPATQIPFPSEWRSTGIYAGAAPGFADQTNKIVIPELAAGASETVVFAWAPPMPSASINADGHFCLLVRLENAADPSLVESWTGYLLADRNNIAQRNLLVVAAAGAPRNPASGGFHIIGTNGVDGLFIQKNFPAAVEFAIPARAVPWREGDLIERHGPRPNCPNEHDWINGLRRSASGRNVEALTAVVGAESLTLRDGLARFSFKGDRLFVPRLRVAVGERVLARMAFIEGLRRSRQPEVHVMQLSDGNMVGGVTLHPRTRKAGSRAAKKDGRP